MLNYETLPNGEKIPKIGLGTWNMGGGMSPNYAQDEKVITAIRTALKLGYTHIDTAEMYADGYTEALIRRAMEGYDREKLVITTKVWSSNLHYRDVLGALEGSLRRLGTDYVDLYLIHWPNTDVPLQDTFKALNELVERGLVLHLGVSNFDLSQLKESQKLSNTPIVTNQVPYSLHNRRYVRNGILDYCQKENVLLTAYTPIEKGRINHPIIRRIAEKHGATPVQIALNWLVRQPRVITIPMSMNPKHIAENLAALEITLSNKDIHELDNLR